MQNLDSAKPKNAINDLKAFINEVSDLVKQSVLTSILGQPLIDAASAEIALLS